MRYISFVLILSLALLPACSCSREESWSPKELWYTAREAEPNIELVLIPVGHEHRRIVCEDYPLEGCVKGTGKRVLIKKVELIVIQYDSRRHACEAALKIKQWYSRDWVLDDVTDEPVLEDFVKKVFNAYRPKRKEDCY
jgi:hypothetical protein